MSLEYRVRAIERYLLENQSKHDPVMIVLKVDDHETDQPQEAFMVIVVPGSDPYGNPGKGETLTRQDGEDELVFLERAKNRLQALSDGPHQTAPA